MDKLDILISESVRSVLNERIKTRDEYADGDKKEAKKLFKSLIGIFNRCEDPKAKKMVEKLQKLEEQAEGVDFTTFKRRYNYTTAQRKKEDKEKWTDGFISGLNNDKNEEYYDYQNH